MFHLLRRSFCGLQGWVQSYLLPDVLYPLVAVLVVLCFPAFHALESFKRLGRCRHVVEQDSGVNSAMSIIYCLLPL